jgi:hypothetical protein
MKAICFAVVVLGLICSSTVIAQVVQPAPADKAVFYQDYRCTTGNKMELGRGSYPDLRTYNTAELGSPTWNDQISCMVIGQNIGKVTVYQHINFKGKSKTFTKTSNNPLGTWSLAKDWWNDSISSMKIE